MSRRLVDAETLEELERQNDAQLERLHEKAAVLKHFSVSLGDEIAESNTLVAAMSSTFAGADTLLGRTHKRLRDLANAPASHGLFCYITLFLIGVFLVSYILWR